MARVCTTVRVLGRRRRNVTLFIVESADSFDSSLSRFGVWPGAPGAPEASGARLPQEHIFPRAGQDLGGGPPAWERTPSHSWPLRLLQPRGQHVPDPPSQTVRQVHILSSAGTSPHTFTSVFSTSSSSLSSISSQGPSILTAAPIELPPQFPAL